MLHDNDESPPQPDKPAIGQEEPRGSAVSTLVLETAAVGTISSAPVSEALKDLVEAGVRGQAGMVLLQTITARLEAELDALRKERDTAREEAHVLRERCFDVEKKNGVLSERLGSRKSLRLMQGILLSLGGIGAGATVQFLQSNPSPLVWISMVFCVLMLIGGWLPIDHWREER